MKRSSPNNRLTWDLRNLQILYIPTLRCQTNLDYSYSLSNCAVMTSYDSILCDLCRDKVYGEVLGEPKLLVHVNWEELNNHQFLQPPPLTDNSLQRCTICGRFK